tara:strand:- start:4894 stop:5793 length:900 start_codon:yes stop_codon:yes gene_type:complete
MSHAQANHSDAPMRGVGNIEQWWWLVAARTLMNDAVLSPTKNQWCRDEGKYKSVTKKEAEDLQKLDTDNPYYLINGYIEKINTSIMERVTGVSGKSIDYNLLRKVEALVNIENTLPIILEAKNGSPVLLGSKVRHPNWDAHITAYKYTGDRPDRPLWQHLRSRKNTCKLTVDTAKNYYDWISKNRHVIASFREHHKAHLAQIDRQRQKYDLKNYSDQLISKTKNLREHTEALDENLRKYGLEQDWLAAIPKHLSKDMPHILGLARDPMVQVKHLTEQVEVLSNKINAIKTKLSLSGVVA